jgi:hypothetical protein
MVPVVPVVPMVPIASVYRSISRANRQRNVPVLWCWL